MGIHDDTVDRPVGGAGACWTVSVSAASANRLLINRGKYDEVYIEYTIRMLRKAQKYDFRVCQ